MPVALRVTGEFGEPGESSWERSSVPAERGVEDFLVAVLALAFLGVERWVASSWARRASRSALLRAASAFFSASASLAGAVLGIHRCWRRGSGDWSRTSLRWIWHPWTILGLLQLQLRRLLLLAFGLLLRLSVEMTESVVGSFDCWGGVWMGRDLRIPCCLLSILATFLAPHDDQICGDVDEDEDTNVWVD